MEGIVLGLGITLHSGFSYDYNYLHPYIEYQYGNLRAGAFYNSEENISTYGGINLQLLNDFSVDTGLVTGYTELSEDQLYDFTPYVKFNYHYNDNVTLFTTPGAEVQDDETVNYGVVGGISFNF
jgi:hypothetical protein